MVKANHSSHILQSVLIDNQENFRGKRTMNGWIESASLPWGWPPASLVPEKNIHLSHKTWNISRRARTFLFSLLNLARLLVVGFLSNLLGIWSIWPPTDNCWPISQYLTLNGRLPLHCIVLVSITNTWARFVAVFLTISQKCVGPGYLW